MVTSFELSLGKSEHRVLASLDTPVRIQSYLNSLYYSDDEFYRCPRRVLKDQKGHCFDGALFAAMALRCIGFPPLIVELIPNPRDDDHLLAVYKINGRWGAIALSNFTGLRFRECVYRTLRELVMSYFEDYFNSLGEKTLRGYRGPINLSKFDPLDWMGSDSRLDELASALDGYPVRTILSAEMADMLNPVDNRRLQAGLLGANRNGLFKISRE